VRRHGASFAVASGGDELPGLHLAAQLLHGLPRKNFADEPSVFLGFSESSGWNMTPDEALLLAHELVHAAEQIKAAKA
jgi:hypothetical protein